MMSTAPNNHEARLRRLEEAHKELEDAFIVMTHLETKQSQMLKEQAEYVANHEKRIREAEERNRDVDARIEKLVSAIGALIAQRP
jgi:hypothetical protein